MSKKLIVTLSVVFSVIAVVLILFWTLFALSSVEVQFSSNRQNLTVTDEEIVQAGKFRLGASVLFEGKRTSIERINNKAKENKNFAYLKVLNIETVFPNKFVIHVTEREQLFAAEIDGQVYVCDHEFRVLESWSVEEYETLKSNYQLITLKGLQIENEQVQVGDFLKLSKQSGMLNLYSAFLANNRSLAEQLGKFSQMSLSSYEDEVTQKEYVSLQMTTYQNRIFEVKNIDFALKEKLQLMFAVESSLFSHVNGSGCVTNTNGQVVYVKQDENGQIVPCTENEGQPLTSEMIYNCKIVVDNLTLTDYVKRTEKDIYYYLANILN